VGGIKNFFHAVATVSAMAAERAKARKINEMITDLKEQTATLLEVNFGPLAAHVGMSIEEAERRIDAEPEVIDAVKRLDAISARAFDALAARNADYELNLAAFAVPEAFDQYSKAVRDAAMRVLLNVDFTDAATDEFIARLQRAKQRATTQ
jgi:aspartate aminotransferase-like enzyme